MKETYPASPNMQKFFTKFSSLKEYVKKQLKNKNDPVLLEIYERIDDMYKSTEEKE